MTAIIGVLISVVGFSVAALIAVAMRLAHEERMRKAYMEAVIAEYRFQLEKDREWFEEYKGDANG